MKGEIDTDKIGIALDRNARLYLAGQSLYLFFRNHPGAGKVEIEAIPRMERPGLQL